MIRHNPPGHKIHISPPTSQEIKEEVFEKEIINEKFNVINDLNPEWKDSCDIIISECKGNGAFIDEAFDDFCSAWNSICF